LSSNTDSRVRSQGAVADYLRIRSNCHWRDWVCGSQLTALATQRCQKRLFQIRPVFDLLRVCEVKLTHLVVFPLEFAHRKTTCRTGSALNAGYVRQSIWIHNPNEGVTEVRRAVVSADLDYGH